MDSIQVQHSASGANLYLVIRNADGDAWNGSTFEAYVTANLGTYDVPMTEQGTASRYYVVAMPAVAAGLYSIVAFVRAGGSPAETDTVVGGSEAEWDGDAFTRLGVPAGVSVSADIAAVKVDTAAILVDTGTTLDSRIPASLVGGRMDASVGAMAANVLTATAITADAITAAKLAADVTTELQAGLPTAAQVADAVWEEAIADHSGTAGSTAEALNAAGAAGDPWVTALPGSYTSGQAGKIVGDTLNATVGSRATQTSVDDVPTNAELATALGTADDAVLASVAGLNNLSAAQAQTAAAAALTAYDPPTSAELDARTLVAGSYATAAGVSSVETDTQDIQSRLPTALVGGRIDATIDATGLEAGAIDAILDETVGDGTLTVREVLRVLVAGMAGKLSGAATTTITIRNAADSANVIVATVDSSGNRSAVTVTP